MNLKLLVYSDRLKIVPVYCILLVLAYEVMNFIGWKQEAPNGSSSPTLQTNLSVREVHVLRTAVQALNFEREVFQAHRYGSVHDATTLLAVRVHKNPTSLARLLTALSRLRYIHSALLVFSHGVFDENINKMIRNVSFCRYMQIFYPFSVQLYPNKFPGIDPEDCLYSLTTNEYCNGRDARLTEHKHHWWWTANFIFDRLEWSQNYKGTVIFLEEDNYVLPDLLYVLRYAKRSLSSLPWVTIMSFGGVFTRNLDSDVLIVDSWRPPYDVGLAFNKTVWKKIAALSSFYCTYDDLRWGPSLLQLFSQFKEGHIDMVATMYPRVLNTAGDATELIKSVENVPLFPTSFKAALVLSSTGKVTSDFKSPSKGNGGWSDIRDHLLCLDPFSSSDYTTNTINVTYDDSTTI